MKIDTGIQEAHRREISQGLSRLLADSYTLYLKTHNYHWNVTGPMFHTLHVMFEEHYMELAAAVDQIAERIRTLGFAAPGSYGQFAELTEIPDSAELPDATGMIHDLVKAHETVVRTGRSLFPLLDHANDEGSADLVTQRIQLHEKTSWMLRSLVEGQPERA